MFGYVVVWMKKIEILFVLVIRLTRIRNIVLLKMSASVVASASASALPMDIVNRIVLLSFMQQDKMYIPQYSEKGRCSWKRNYQSSAIQKIEKMLQMKLRYPPKQETIRLDHQMYPSITLTLTSDGEGNKEEYTICEPTVPETELYFMKRWTYIILSNGYKQPYLTDGLIYTVYNRGYDQMPGREPEYWNGFLFHKRTFREINMGDYWEFYGMPNAMGKYILDTKTNIYEFVMNPLYMDTFEEGEVREPDTAMEDEDEDEEENEEEEDIVYGNSGDLPDDLVALLAAEDF